METIDRKVLYSINFGEYIVNIHGLLQCSVDERYVFVWSSEVRRAVTDSLCPEAADDGDQQCKLQMNRWADAPNSIPIQNAHKCNFIKLEDVDSILDCNIVIYFLLLVI